MDEESKPMSNDHTLELEWPSFTQPEYEWLERQRRVNDMIMMAFASVPQVPRVEPVFSPAVAVARFVLDDTPFVATTSLEVARDAGLLNGAAEGVSFGSEITGEGDARVVIGTVVGGPSDGRELFFSVTTPQIADGSAKTGVVENDPTATD